VTGSTSAVRHVAYEDVYQDALFEDLPRRVPDTTRIGELIGWRARLGLDEILRDVVASVRVEPAMERGAAA
jgi:UDP-glucose 4-epimerase